MFLIFAPCQVPAILHLLMCLLAQSRQEFVKINLGQRWSTQKQAMVKYVSQLQSRPTGNVQWSRFLSKLGN